MRMERIWMCAWPGLPWLWQGGQIRGLIAAVLFTILLNGALVATFVWPEWLGSMPVAALWLAIGTIWLVSAWNSHSHFRTRSTLPKCDEPRETVRESADRAQRHYLQGHWLEAEAELRRLLARSLEPEGIAFARLTLSAVFRRTHRWDEAQLELGYLANLPECEKWKAEIQRATQRLSSEQNLSRGNHPSSLESCD